MKNKYIILVITLLTLICTPAVSQEHETPNARQARRMFMEAYTMPSTLSASTKPKVRYGQNRRKASSSTNDTLHGTTT